MRVKSKPERGMQNSRIKTAFVFQCLSDHDRGFAESFRFPFRVPGRCFCQADTRNNGRQQYGKHLQIQEPAFWITHVIHCKCFGLGEILLHDSAAAILQQLGFVCAVHFEPD